MGSERHSSRCPKVHNYWQVLYVQVLVDTGAQFGL
jgi:hypothetical protein